MSGKPRENETRELLKSLVQTPLDQPMGIKCNGDHQAAVRCLSRLRSELSRSKKRIEARGRVPASWSLIHVRTDVSTDPISKKQVSTLWIKRSIDPMQKKVSDEVDELLDALDEGKQVLS